MSYRKIRDELSSRNINSPRGDHWATTTLVEMLKENRLEQYAGTAFWNREDKKTKGNKYKPRDQWVITENAHPAIISQEELEEALERRRQNQYNAPDGATRTSSYLLTGKNFENNLLFTCRSCGKSVIGYGNSSHNWKRYICGTNRTRGPVACDNNWLIDRDWLEESILLQIESRYTAPDKVDDLLKDIEQKAALKNKEVDKSISIVESQLKKCNTEIKHLLDAIKSGIDPSLISEEVNALKLKRDGLEGKLATLRKSYSTDHYIDIDALGRFFVNFRTAFTNATIEERRQLIRTFIRHVELVPETKEIRVEFYPDHIVQSIGAGDRNRTGTGFWPEGF